MLGFCVSWVGRNVSSLGAEVLEVSGSRDGERQISSNSDRCRRGDRELQACRESGRGVTRFLGLL